jgi:REP element-mobilizing transposase RayT
MAYDSFKHHRRSIRLRGYDYSQAGAYFISICEVNRECIFGDIVDGEMRRNQFGEIVLKWWNELPNYYPPVQLDEFIVMPNHLHGIIEITNVGAGSPRPNFDTPRPNIDAPPPNFETPHPNIDAPRPNFDAPRADGQPDTGQHSITRSDIGQSDITRPDIGRGHPAPTEKRALGQLVGYFKFKITNEINQIRDASYAKLFQHDYYEHIIRQEREWNVIAKYIRNNPANWHADLDNPRNFSKRPHPKTSDEYWNDAVVGAGLPRPYDGRNDIG